MSIDFVLSPNTNTNTSREGSNGPRHGFLEGQVKDVMTRVIVAVLAHTPLRDVERLLEERGFSGVPVVNEDGLLLGMLTKFDTLRAVAFTKASFARPYEELLRLPAERLMTRNPRTVHPHTPLVRVLETLVRTRYKSLPVVREGRLEGIVSRTDVLGALRRAAA
jgi:CBS domain-containing protein